MYLLYLERTEDGKVIGQCNINGIRITSEPKAKISQVLDEIRRIAHLLGEHIDEDPIFEVVWIKQ